MKVVKNNKGCSKSKIRRKIISFKYCSNILSAYIINII